MSFVLGESHIKSVTGKVDIYTPLHEGRRRRVARLEVTVRTLPRDEFMDLLNSCTDIEVAKALIENIKPGDAATQATEYTPDLVEKIYQYGWQFHPIYEFVLAANDERLQRSLHQKN